MIAGVLASTWNPWNWGRDFSETQQRYWSEQEKYLVVVVGIYLCLVFLGPKIMAKNPLGPGARRYLKWANALWNLGLSVFSCFGMACLAPHLLRHFQGHGFFYTVCTPPIKWYAMGPSGFWMETFVLSKFPELLDTVFLVLQGKKVIFLHWYHHVTVLLFCLQAYIRDAAPGIWYASMNYSVHAVMYAYYAGMAVPQLRKILSTFSVFITIAQILQMVVGAFVTLSAAWWWYQGRDCHLRQSTCVFGCIIYFSYFVLFVSLFTDKYCGRGEKGAGASKNGESSNGKSANGKANGKTNGENGHEHANGSNGSNGKLKST